MKAIIFVSILLLPLSTLAAVYGGSNLGYSGYPEFSGYEPSPPFSDDQFAMDNYKREVEDYVNKAKEYVENADLDSRRVKESQQDAIEKANRVVEDYNRKVNGY